MQNDALTVEKINFIPEIPPTEEKKESRFNILEILVVFSAVAVVGLLGLLAINPSKESAEARNLQRSADISTILSYLTAYVGGTMTIPEQIPKTKTCVEYMNEICKSGPYNCTDLVNLNFLNGGSEEVLIIPQDPKHISINGTGYFVFQEESGKVTVCAPYAERSEEISFSKFLY